MALRYNGEVLGVLRVEEIYGWDKRLHAERVYGTRDPGHPGVARVMGMKELLVGGRVDLLNPLPNPLEKYTSHKS